MVPKYLIILFALVGACLGCFCVPKTEHERLKSHKFVYTVLVASREQRIINGLIHYKVIIQGIPKRSARHKFEYIGMRTTLYTASNACGLELEVGRVYVVGGYWSGEDNKKTISKCSYPTLLSTNFQPGIDFTPCSVLGCRIWTDGCSKWHCSVDGSPGFAHIKSCVLSGAPKCTSTKNYWAADRCWKGCKTFFDGCNTCSCKANGKFKSCTKKICNKYVEPKCLSPSKCPKLKCPEGKRCKFVQQKDNPCGELVRMKSTYKCDPLSEWRKWEQNNCLKNGRSMAELGCIKSQCCATRNIPFGGQKKLTYCRYSPFCSPNTGFAGEPICP